VSGFKQGCEAAPQSLGIELSAPRIDGAEYLAIRDFEIPWMQNSRNSKWMIPCRPELVIVFQAMRRSIGAASG
jgi:hypothetical protein